LEYNHKPVLLNSAIENLNIKPDGIYVDGTLGGAGHSICILQKLNEKGLLIGIDKDSHAIEFAKKKLSSFNNVEYINDNNSNLKEILENLDIEKVDGILLDLGVSSYQLDEEARGFSYMKDTLLDMRMDISSSLTAKDVVNTYTEEELTRILYEYGEERFSKRTLRHTLAFGCAGI